MCCSNPKGPSGKTSPDAIQHALAGNPEAAATFDGLAQFYRRAFLTWIDATKRKPEERERRIAETVDLLARGEKQVPDDRGAR